ncbi:hypothetical protein [Fibrella aquatilis]|uniref:MoxR-vWA-beta-propeller ternary system domain-containing protein n=1 Tax=Fibrella aquatilis TaxID=2817059 RepID=A0A939G698_9BACT|nr:hypothetical protein [Fibrella aquatilis]MBO0931805.1 hypothetical protein [Fibrella aquatilis]
MTNHFLQTIQRVRRHEEVILWDNGLVISQSDEGEVAGFLADEYRREALDYPFVPPAFDEAAACWGARTVYTAAQLGLFRQHKPDDLPALLPPCANPVSAAAMLSADLMLRFLPDLVLFLTQIDADDPLIPLLEKHLHTWHFSAIAYPVIWDDLDLTPLTQDPCLCQRYIDRLLAHNKQPAPTATLLWNSINAALGDHARQLTQTPGYFHQL